MEQGSNFRDIGRYHANDGRTMRWGKAFRSGAMPLLNERDNAVLGELNIDSIVDLRSLEGARSHPTCSTTPGALFLSNDYSIKPLLAGYRTGNGENMYRGMEKILAPQPAIWRHCRLLDKELGITARDVEKLRGIILQ